MNLILLGAPGSGKGTQAKTLAGALGAVHVASGDLFRDHLQRRTELGRLAEGYMNRGDLVPDDVTIGMIRERLRDPDAAGGVLLDGFPRTLAQAKALDALLAELGKAVDGALYLAVPDEVLVERLAGRRVCAVCQAPFHAAFNPFRVCPLGRCAGEHLHQREDDRAETVRARLATFHRQTEPVVAYYDQAGLLVHVSGEGPVAEVSARAIDAVRGMGKAPI